MLARRLIPCLDVRGGRVVKGVRFRDHRVVGDIMALAGRYRDEGADELVFYDIGASPAGRGVDRDWVGRVNRVLDIPFCVAGGIRSVDDARRVLNAGADKISVNSPALARPGLIDELAAEFGSQCVVVGVDSRRDGGTWRVYQYTGDPERARTSGRPTREWVEEVQARGAGEIVLNCMDADGVRGGYDLEQLIAIRGLCRVPLVASGGAGSMEHFRDAFLVGGAHAALAASVFHAGRIRIPDLKSWLAGQGIEVRTGPPPSLSTGKQGGGWKQCKHQTVARMTKVVNIDTLDWDKCNGLVPAVVQDFDTGRVLMLGYMDRDALAQTRALGRVTFYSRSRRRLWTKGETSGNHLDLVALERDCDADALLVLARPAGPTCHLGRASCFERSGTPVGILGELDQVIQERAAADPASSYTARLLRQGVHHISRKLGEESVETVLAAVSESDDRLTDEAADLLYHLMVLLRARGLSLQDLAGRLGQRRR